MAVFPGWPEDEIRTTKTDNAWRVFLEFANHGLFHRWAEGAFVFRGQANADWPLTPKLLRDEIGHKDAEWLLKLEDANLKHYMTRAWSTVDRQLIPEDTDDTLLASWALMQHYEAPTRLLDWTTSPFIALYFAVKDEPEADAAVWFFNHDALNKSCLPDPTTMKAAKAQTYFERKSKSNKVHAFRSAKPTPRLLVQRGQHTVCQHIKGDQTKLIPMALTGCGSPTKPACGRFIVPKEHKEWFFLFLLGYGFDAAHLLPGIDGIGKDVAERLENIKVGLRVEGSPGFDDRGPYLDEGEDDDRQ